MRLTKTETIYKCDKCGNELKDYSDVDLKVHEDVTPNIYWSRIHLIFERHHGINNNETVDKASLCQSCAISLLNSAIQLIISNIRKTAGAEKVDPLKFTI